MRRAGFSKGGRIVVRVRVMYKQIRVSFVFYAFLLLLFYCFSSFHF